MPDFLLEIGCEEIPARMIDGAREELARRVSELLQRERLAESPAAEAFSTPRRLALVARGIAAQQPDVEEQVLGPAIKVAYKDGAPAPPAEAFAKKVGLPLDKLERAQTPKGEYLAARVVKKGRSAGEILAEELPREIAGLYWAKSMYWRGKGAERFVRPVRWMVALLDGAPIPLEFAGTRANSASRGHRLLGESASIASAGEYAAALSKAGVVASPAEREQRIRKALDAAARTLPSARWREDAPLLNKVVNLTEWPAVVAGAFDQEFLVLPEEVLVTVMRDHQNYFALEDAGGKLLPHFLAVLNIDGDPDGLIRHGHERVLRARFKDARFFWQADQRTPLRERVEMLRAVTFQKDLGSYHEKAQRMQRLAQSLCERLNAAGVTVDKAAAAEAALHAKADLTTELVKEFTELQGVVGGLYARAQGLAAPVAEAIYDQYKPAATDDELPRHALAAVVGLADRADSIAGMFSLGLQPSGSKDPFALRRQANAAVRILAEHKLPLGVPEIFQLAAEGYQGSPAAQKFTLQGDAYSAALAGFFRERLEFYLREGSQPGFAYDVVNAALAAGSDDPADALARAAAVAQVRGSEDFTAIATSFKRIKNILRQAREANKVPAAAVDAALLQEEPERALSEQMAAVAPRVEQRRRQRDYAGALAEIAALRPAIDRFFDKVMVMAEDERVRANRLALLERLLGDFSTIADFSEIVTERKAT